MRVSLTNFSSGINTKIDENLARWNDAQMCYNFRFSDGALKSGVCFLGLKGANSTSSGLVDSLPIDETGFRQGRVFYFQKYDFERVCRDDKLLILGDNMKIYYASLFAYEPVWSSLDYTFSSVPTAVAYRLNGEDVILFSSPTDGLLLWTGEGEMTKIESAPKISSMAFHYERLFAISSDNPYELWFSDDLDPTNWNIDLDSAGFIQMIDDRGALKKVISYNDYLYVLRERGISRLSATGAQESFYLSHMFVSSGKIFANTAELCGDKILFVSTSGLCVFDGVDVRPILEGVSELIRVNDQSCCAYYDGKYYLSCKMNFGDLTYVDDAATNNALLVVDVNDFSYEIIRGLSVASMVTVTAEEIDSVVFLLTTGDCPLIRPVKNDEKEVIESVEDSSFATPLLAPLVASWRTGLSDLGRFKKQKVVRRVGGVLTKGATEVLISNEKGDTVVFAFGEGENSAPTRLVGERFSLKLNSRVEKAGQSAIISSLWVDIV